jgi:hypothetical protein
MLLGTHAPAGAAAAAGGGQQQQQQQRSTATIRREPNTNFVIHGEWRP